MKSTRLRLCGALLAVLALAACSFQDQGLASMIPDNALGFVQISDPDLFIKNLDSLMVPLGLSAMTNNVDLRSLLSLGLKSSAQLDLADFDLKKPLGLAILPPQKDSQDFGFILYLPLLKPQDSGPKLQKILESSGKIEFSSSNGYGIFAQSAGTLTFPPAKALKIPQSLVFTPGTVVVYGDIQSALAHYKDEWSKLKQEALAEFEGIESSAEGGKALPDSTKASTKAMLDTIFRGVEQTRSIAIQVAPDATGLSTRSTVEFDKDGEIARLFQAIGSGKDLAAQARYLDSGALMSGMVSGDPQAFKPLYQALLDQYFSAAKLADADKAVFRKLMDDSFRLAGKNLAWSFDLQLDPGLSAMNPDQVMANLDKAFGLSLVMVQDLADAEGYKKFLKDNVGGGILKKYLDTVMAETGFQMDIKLEDKKDGDLAYQEMSFSLAVGDPDKLSMTSDEARAAATVTASLMQKMAMVLGAKGNRLYVVMGDNGLEKLKKVIADDRVEKPLSAMPVWSEWVKTIPGDAQYAGHLSVSRLADLVNVFADNSLKLEVPEADRSGLNSWIQIKDAHITGSASWNIKEMGPVVKASIDFAMAMFSRNAFSGAGGSDSGFSEGDSEPDGDPAAAGGE